MTYETFTIASFLLIKILVSATVAELQLKMHKTDNP